MTKKDTSSASRQERRHQWDNTHIGRGHRGNNGQTSQEAREQRELEYVHEVLDVGVSAESV